MYELRFALGLAVAGGLILSHVYAYKQGEEHVRTEWQASVAAANEEARRLERARQSRADEAARVAASREARIVADARRARGESDGLRDDLNAIRLHASQSLDAATKSVAALSDVFQQCSRRYQELAEIADRHANDSLRLQQSWPK